MLLHLVTAKYHILGAITLLIASLSLSAYGDDSAVTQDNESQTIQQDTNTLTTSAGFKTDIPFKQDNTFGLGFLLKLTLVLLFVVAIAYVAILLLKKFNYGMTVNPALTTGESIKVIEVKRLTPKLLLFSLDVEGEKILLAQNGDNVSFFQRHNQSTVTSSGIIDKTEIKS